MDFENLVTALDAEVRIFAAPQQSRGKVSEDLELMILDTDIAALEVGIVSDRLRFLEAVGLAETAVAIVAKVDILQVSLLVEVEETETVYLIFWKT